MKRNILFILIILISGCVTNETLTDGHEATQEHLDQHAHEEKVHIHADFKVYINDKQIDFSVSKYQLQAKSVHVEDGIGEVVHVHKKRITIGDFFETLGIEFNNTCIILPADGSYCNTGDRKLSFYINGIENSKFENYEIKNFDKILVSYGNGSIEKQLDSVTDLAKTTSG